MAIELKVPSAGESITEVVVVEWLRGEGAFAKKDEAVALIETDKANVDVVAPADGVVQKVLKRAGERARVGETIAMFEPGAQASASPSPAAARSVPSSTRADAGESRASSTRAADVSAAREERMSPLSEGTSSSLGASGTSAEEHLTPSQRRATRSGNGHQPEPTRAKPTQKPPRTLRPGERAVPMTPLRKRLAERLLEAQQTAALLTTFNELDMSAVMALRKQYADTFKEKHGVKLGFMSFFVKATTEALRAFPAINAEIHNDDIIYRDFADIGVAVGGGKGLVVPILRNAQTKTFAQLEKEIADFAERAKIGRLKVEELQGGTFTISNGGIYGSLMSTPIVNPPQSGILGMHAIQERPIAKNGAVAIAPMMYVALTYDHRIVDGREAVSFLVRVKEGIENPARLLLEV